jgi:hypothetical protein
MTPNMASDDDLFDFSYMQIVPTPMNSAYPVISKREIY